MTPDEKLERDFLRLIRKEFLFEMYVMIDATGSRKLIEENDPIFRDALMAQFVEDADLDKAFGARLLAGTRGAHPGVAEKFAAAVKVARTHILKVKLGGNRLNSQAGKYSMALHAFWAVALFDHLERTNQPAPTKQALEMLVTAKLSQGNSLPYSDASDWRKLWKLLRERCHIELSQARPGRNSTFSGG